MSDQQMTRCQLAMGANKRRYIDTSAELGGLKPEPDVQHGDFHASKTYHLPCERSDCNAERIRLKAALNAAHGKLPQDHKRPTLLERARRSLSNLLNSR